MPPSCFILEAFDRQQWCPVLQAMLEVDDLDALRAILGEASNGDPELEWIYHLDDSELAAIVTKFDLTFDVAQLDATDLDFKLFRWHRRRDQTPYLIHTGYELPLLLDGRKKLARMTDLYPPTTFDGEDRFDHWVAEGVLHREEVKEAFNAPRTVRGQVYLGHRTVYYTPKGEEWRIPAMKLIWRAGRWNEDFERLEGMLFGYEDWQNDWWINEWLARRGGVGGVSFCCVVTAEGLAWIETAGFRALPPVGQPVLTIMNYDWENEADVCATAFANPRSAAVVRFNLARRDVMDLLDLRHGGPWEVKAEHIAELNRVLHGSVVIVAKRDGAIEDGPAKPQLSARSA
jgi:hypothetical protein